VSLELPYPEEMLRDFAKGGCAKCGGKGVFKAVTPRRIIHEACKCALKNIQRRAKKLNRYADMLITQEN